MGDVVKFPTPTEQIKSAWPECEHLHCYAIPEDAQPGWSAFRCMLCGDEWAVHAPGLKNLY